MIMFTLLKQATAAQLSVNAARDNATKAVEELKNLLVEIEALLGRAVATPAEIRQKAESCMRRKPQLTSAQIQELSAQIQDTIESLSDIERILKETENDKARTATLKHQAEKVK